MPRDSISGFGLRWTYGQDQTELCRNGTIHNALEEVGSVHTIQGHDLSCVGFILGMSLRLDPGRRRLFKDNNKIPRRIIAEYLVHEVSKCQIENNATEDAYARRHKISPYVNRNLASQGVLVFDGWPWSQSGV